MIRSRMRAAVRAVLSPRRGLPALVATLALAAFAGSSLTRGAAATPALTASPSSAAIAADSALAAHAGHAAAGPATPATSSTYWRAVAGAAFRPTGVTRTSYVSADEVVWNYAPAGRDIVAGTPFAPEAQVFVARGPGRVGSRYLKCIYRAYTDASFRRLTARPAADAYLGFLGPVIRAEVGDTIRVVFRNACPFPTGMHPHGVRYAKGSEGALYADGTRGAAKGDDQVPQGGRRTYVWRVPERAGPGPSDGSSVMWMYHGHTSEIADTYAGLVGPIVVTRRGMARPDGSPKDLDWEVFELFEVVDETQSPLLAANVRRFAGRPGPIHPEEDEEFHESSLKHSINGYLYGNQPLVTLRTGQHVRWYVMGMGTEVDLHTPHWHGNTVTVMGTRMDTVSLLPGAMVVADMVPDNPGTWLFHCHVNDHIAAGMTTRYRVLG